MYSSIAGERSVSTRFVCAHRPMRWGLASEQNFWTALLQVLAG